MNGPFRSKSETTKDVVDRAVIFGKLTVMLRDQKNYTDLDRLGKFWNEFYYNLPQDWRRLATDTFERSRY
jgi:hypothetical protein